GRPAEIPPQTSPVRTMKRGGCFSFKLAQLPSRRQVLKWVGAGAAAAAWPSGCGNKVARWAPSFFTDQERRALGALADAVLPPDDQPGGSALGAVAFIEKLATVYEAPTAVPEIYAG